MSLIYDNTKMNVKNCVTMLSFIASLSLKAKTVIKIKSKFMLMMIEYGAYMESSWPGKLAASVNGPARRC